MSGVYQFDLLLEYQRRAGNEIMVVVGISVPITGPVSVERLGRTLFIISVPATFLLTSASSNGNDSIFTDVPTGYIRLQSVGGDNPEEFVISGGVISFDGTTYSFLLRTEGASGRRVY